MVEKNVSTGGAGRQGTPPGLLRCGTCKVEKTFDNFTRNKNFPTGYWARCKACQKAWREANRARLCAAAKEKYRKNIEHNKEARARRYHANKEEAKQKSREYHHAHYAEIREKRREYMRQYKEANRERLREQGREYMKDKRETDPEGMREKGRAWARANRKKASLRSTRYYHRKRCNGGDFTGADWEAIKEAQDFRCLRCGRREPEIKLEVDHIIPVTRGGPNLPCNLQGLCGTCNKNKNTHTTDLRPPEMRARFGTPTPPIARP
jgi:5-methylcytosine-specific restriction endonuclease McrA